MHFDPHHDGHSPPDPSHDSAPSAPADPHALASGEHGDAHGGWDPPHAEHPHDVAHPGEGGHDAGHPREGGHGAPADPHALAAGEHGDADARVNDPPADHAHGGGHGASGGHAHEGGHPEHRGEQHGGADVPPYFAEGPHPGGFPDLRNPVSHVDADAEPDTYASPAVYAHAVEEAEAYASMEAEAAAAHAAEDSPGTFDGVRIPDGFDGLAVPDVEPLDGEYAAETGEGAGEEAHFGRPRVPSPFGPAHLPQTRRPELYVPGLLDRARTAWPGRPWPLGATPDAEGTNFAIYSEQAVDVVLCVFLSPGDEEPVQTYRLRERTAYVWHGYVPGLRPGTFYGYKINGTYDPGRGLRCTPFKLLVDPYARALAGRVRWEHHPFAYHFDQPGEDWVLDDEDDSAGVPKGVVMADDFDWRGDAPPSVPWHETVIYEAHVKGLTMLHPEVPPEIRGTYAALAHPAIIGHLKSLGITALELMPVHEIVDDYFLVQKGLRNYWGYNTLNFFAPAGRYASVRDYGGQVREFKEMVRALHADGIEVILDVVYNHTAEGHHLGPTLSFRGIDNRTYYRLVPGNPRMYMDYTGTGNSFNLVHPQTLTLVMDSLRYWVQEMHVDGFRFDLASTLARELHEVDKLSSFFDVIHQDPVLSRVKLIAEPWDVGEGGYQVGNFPVLWAEWNGKYRDTVRAYWRGDPGTVGELGYRLTGSSDLYENDGRRPHASINFVTAHDGFTLNDLVSYNHKHNEANGEHNRDGDNHNLSYNFGVEGPTDRPDIIRMRERQKRNFMATLLLSQGVPMICHGDEMGRTQHGNNNAYAQDNEVAWVSWDLTERDQELLEFTRRVSRLRREHPTFRRRKFFRGRQIRGSDVRDIVWLSPVGTEMTDQEWNAGYVRCFGMALGGDAMEEWNDRGEQVRDENFLLLLNADGASIDFTLPDFGRSRGWCVLLDTARPDMPERHFCLPDGETVTLEGRSMMVLVEDGVIE
ncbi:MAG TPA: glycogen debranching protein GlgX [Longimicrobium sp.]|nr:glycogen debranching protein GlgX [Longimicrobium sp.]